MAAEAAADGVPPARSVVMAGLDPAFHPSRMMDARVKPAHDEERDVATLTMTKVTKLKCLGGYRLHATFSDGTAGEYDFSTRVAETGPMIEPLRDPAYFARVFLEYGAPTWPNGYDMCPDWLRREIEMTGQLTPRQQTRCTGTPVRLGRGAFSCTIHQRKRRNR